MILKKLCFFALIAVLALLTACGKKNPAVLTFGDPVDSSKAISAKDLRSKMAGNATFNGIISGNVVNVCKAEGCWMKIDIGEEEPLMVRMKDHLFTVTENVEGKFAFALGQAHYDTLSVEKLRDFAKDEGSSQAEIDAITAPEYDLVFEAKGIAVR